MERGRTRVAIVGPCGSGKSALKEQLLAHGYSVSAVAQEHSYVPDMWERLSRPDVLIYLDVSVGSIRSRLQREWRESWLEEQNHRLRDARSRCSLYVPTDGKSQTRVASEVVAYLERRGDE